MRYVQERFTDEEFERLKAGKGNRTWREALLEDVAADPEEVHDGTAQ